MATTWKQEYVEALKNYLGKPGEDTRERAYEIGRQAIEEGLSLLDLASLQLECMDQAIYPAYVDKSCVARSMDCAAFFSEIIAPFEMMIRGYREANQALEAANRELEAFSYSAAHDLKTPLRAIDGFSHILLEDYGSRLDPEGLAHLNKIRRNIKGMANLIDALLSLGRLSKVEIKRQHLDISGLAQGIARELQDLDSARPVKWAIAPGLAADADADLMRILFMNLIGNAWKFTKKIVSAKIEVGSLSRHGQEVFFVQDNGAGFDMEYADKLFGVFQRLHSTTEFEGTGIGLATVQRVVQRHGGRIWADGVLGKGATFYFTLS